MSHQSDVLPCDQLRDQVIGNQSSHTQLMETLLHLRQTVDDCITQLTTRPPQLDLPLEEQRHNQATGEQEAFLRRVVNLLQSGAMWGLGLQAPRPTLGPRDDAGGGQQAQLSRQLDQLVHQLSHLEVAFVSHDLSNRGIDISAFERSKFQDFKTYQGDKYHEDKNTMVRIGGGHT